jgi:hypothetical protein
MGTPLSSIGERHGAVSASSCPTIVAEVRWPDSPESFGDSETRRSWQAMAGADACAGFMQARKSTSFRNKWPFPPRFGTEEPSAPYIEQRIQGVGK